jgi:hypothetical protein
VTLPHFPTLPTEMEESRNVRMIYPVGDLIRLDTPWDCASSDRKLSGLMFLIHSATDPGLWRMFGGSAGIVTHEDMLIVDAPPALQEQVVMLLGVLRARSR